MAAVTYTCEQNDDKKEHSVVTSYSYNCFVYGTLQSTDILLSLLHRVPPMKKATLHGYKRHALHGRLYPAITSRNITNDISFNRNIDMTVANDSVAKVVEGTLLKGLNSKEMDILNAFEDSDYKATDVEVCIDVGNERVEAIAYVWNANVEAMDAIDWSLEAFLHNEKFNEYLENSRRFRALLDQREVHGDLDEDS